MTENVQEVEEQHIQQEQKVQQSMNEIESIEFSIDLVHMCQQHLYFLQYMHENGYSILSTTNSSSTIQSIQRYKDYWLPLVAIAYDIQYGNNFTSNAATTTTTTTLTKHEISYLTYNLIPPCDVAWNWHCHRLAPKIYKEYIYKEFSNRYNTKCDPTKNDNEIYINGSNETILNMMDPKQPFQIVNGNNITRKLWNDLYPNVSFDLVLTKDTVQTYIKSHKRIVLNESQYINEIEQQSTTSTDLSSNVMLVDGYNLLLASLRQQSFWYQVLTHNYQCIDYIQNIFIPMYIQFLLLKRNYRKELTNFLLVPTYSIDLIWHTHILTCIHFYETDCINIIGHTFNHNDNIGSRDDGPESQLLINWQSTCNLWYNVYNVDYSCLGGYQGTPSNKYYQYAYRGIEKLYKQQKHIQYMQRRRQQQQQQQKRNYKPHQNITATFGRWFS